MRGKGEATKSTKTWSFAELSDEARKCKDFTSKVDVNDQRFLSPESMSEAVREACRKSGQAVPESVGELLQCVYLSLTDSYAQTIKELEPLTGKKYTSINIVGGGCQDNYLNELTARATGLCVHAGPAEGTSLGNLIVQFIYSGEFENLADARDAVYESFSINAVNP